MEPRYNSESAWEAFAKFSDVYSEQNKDRRSKYSVSVAGGFRFPPIIVANRYWASLTSGQENLDLLDECLKHSILRKKVTVYFGDDEIGSFQINGVQDSWDAYEVLVEHPMVYREMTEAVSGFILGKFTPPLKNDPAPKASSGPMVAQ